MEDTEKKVRRCGWVRLGNPAYVSYHDHEWGKVSRDDGYLFEMLLLESFQAGLSWECVLNKRENFRAAFDGFDYKKIALYDARRQERLRGDAGIIRNRLKIKAAVRNAGVFMRIQEEFGSFYAYIWHFTDGKPVVHRDGVVRATSPLSDAISRDLKKRGMTFVGSTIVYAYLQAIGVVDDHEAGCDFAAPTREADKGAR